MYSATHVVGGQSIPKFDYDLAIGIRKTFIKKYLDNIIKGIIFKTGESKDDTTKLVKGIYTKIKDNYNIQPILSGENEYQQKERTLLAFTCVYTSDDKSRRLEMNDIEDIQKTAHKIAVEETDRATYQAMEGFVHNLNTMSSRAGAQVPFSSINYGTDTSPEGRMIIKNVLLAQEAGLGNGETPIFPIHIFKVKEGVNFNPNDPNYDMFKLACRVSAKRLFPNFEFIDAPFNLKYYKEGNPDTEIATMGAAIGSETVTIKIVDKIYFNIPIAHAYDLIYAECCNDITTPDWLDADNIGVFMISHRPTGLHYIVGTTDIRLRVRECINDVVCKGALGNHHLGDRDYYTNYDFEILEICDIDDLWKCEQYWNDIFNHNATGQSQIQTLSITFNCQFVQSAYVNDLASRYLAQFDTNDDSSIQEDSHYHHKITGKTHCSKCDMTKIFILSHGSWTPIRSIIYNDPTVPLDLLRIHFNGKSIGITEDHPLHTTRGRIEARDLKIGDKLIDATNNSIMYEITKIERIDRQETYDFETDNDMFDLSGIMSHNCRTRVIGNVYDPSREIVTGRGNLSFTTINLPRLAIEAKRDIDKFFKSLDEMMNLVIAQLKHRFKIQCQKHVYNFPFLMGQGVWLDSEKLIETDDISEVLKHGSLSVGFIGLAECLVALIGKHHGESEEAQELGLKIIRHMRERTDKESEETHLNFTLFATPAESLSGRFIRIDKKRYGIIPGVTDKDYYTNSTHVPVYYPISAFDKIRIEAPYHELTNAGHISYVELDGDPTENLHAFEKIVRYMKQCGIGYGAINHPIDTDPICGYTGVIKNTCPHCGRREHQAVIAHKRIPRINYKK